MKGYVRSVSASVPARILLLDPIAFNGGSKVANRALLGLLPQEEARVTVLTRDPLSWQGTGWELVHLFDLAGCHNAESGLRYYARQFFFSLQVMLQRCRLGRRVLLMGGSGPGVDLSLYISALWPPAIVLQLVHGPVAASRICALCLKRADYVFFVPSAADSLSVALRRIKKHWIMSDHDITEDRPHWLEFHNGIPAGRWPSSVLNNGMLSPGPSIAALRIFWAASLLKWKGLDVLLEALNIIALEVEYEAHICFFRPRDTFLPVTEGPQELNAMNCILPGSVHWYEAPQNLDKIRSLCSVFVSTSDREPFGLSILESLAAGLCVLIPQDGAFWDQRLEHGVNCIKYRPQNATDLAMQLKALAQMAVTISEIGRRGQECAAGFRAEQTYAPILAQIRLAIHQGLKAESRIPAHKQQ